MKRTIFSGVFALLLVLSLALAAAVLPATDAQAVATIWYVAATGDDTTGDGSEGSPWATIQHAIDEAEEGDIIIVAAGTYTESIIIDKSLTLQSEDGADDTTIDGDITIVLGWDDEDIAGELAETVALDGFTADYVYLSVDNGSDVTISNNFLRMIASGVTTLDNGSAATIEGNEISGWFGISFDHVTGGSTLDIIDNTITGNNDNGIWIWAVEDSAVTIEDNDIQGNWGRGIYIRSIGNAPETVTIIGNAITGNSADGIYIEEVSDSTVTIEDNAITFNGYKGIDIGRVEDSTMTIQDNDIQDNGWDGICIGIIVNSPDTVVITGNTITGNFANGIYIGEVEDSAVTIEDNAICGNYWAGICIAGFYGDSAAAINYNAIAGNNDGLEVSASEITVDARYNWWGDVAGPLDDTTYQPINPYQGYTSGDSVYGDLNYIPWMIQSEMAEGWNIWSAPIFPDPASWTQMKADLAAEAEAIYYFNSVTQLWVSGMTGAGPLDAYYIKMPEAATIRYYFSDGATFPAQKAMKVGWNLIGLGELYAMPVNNALLDAYYGTGEAGPWGYTKAISPMLNQNPWTYQRDDGTPDMIPMEGYWVFMVNNGILGGFASTPIIKVSDTTEPALASFAFTPDEIDTTDSSTSVTFTLRLTDDISGVSFADWTLRSPSEGQSRYGSAYSYDRTSGNARDGMYVSSVYFPQYSEDGTWHVAHVNIQDSAGNWVYISEQDLIALGFPTEIEVNCENPDMNPPLLTGFEFDPTEIDTTEGSVGVTFTLGLIDDLSGVSSVNWTLRSPSGQQSRSGFASHPFNLTDGDKLDGVYVSTVTFPQNREEGEWYVYSVQMRDTVGNSMTLYEDDLIGMAFNTKLDVTGVPAGGGTPTPMPSPTSSP